MTLHPERAHPSRHPVLLLLVLLLLGSSAWAEAIEGTASKRLREGERLFREGLDLAGAPLRALAQGEIPLPPAQAACASCHRRSAMGGIEGQILVPPVVGEYLYQPGSVTAQAFGQTFVRRAKRPAYTDATLARALREGIDPGGRPLAAPMPRYVLSDRQVSALQTYLKSLSSTPAPGVDAESIHFATVISEDVPAASRRMLADLLISYSEDRRSDTIQRHRQRGPGSWAPPKDRGARSWTMHLWALRGPPDTWRRQLDDYYEKRPVFALLSGLATAWAPVHDFCNAQALPCLFPTTDLPPAEAGGPYVFYFSRGMALEAEVVARYLSAEPTPASVIHRVDDEPRSQAAGSAFRSALGHLGGFTLRELGDQRAATQLSDMIATAEYPPTLVLWSSRADLNALVPFADRIQRIVVSSTLLGGFPEVPPALSGKVAVVHPFVLPEHKPQHLAYLHRWLDVKRIPLGDERIQSEAYFAATSAADALRIIGSHFSRDYFMEQIEEMIDNAAVRSIYPHLSLGPGQRFASKGGYVITRFPGDGMTEPSARTNDGEDGATWIVP